MPLQRKPLYLLKYLLQNGDRVVPSTELTREIWRGVAVTDASLRRAVRVLRQTLGEGYVVSARGYGYRFIAAVQTHSSDPPARAVTMTAPLPSDPFVGRSEELEGLDGALDHALQGELRFVLVTAPPGMGKSRLAREFLDRADARGVNTAVGYCWDGGGSPAFWPWGSLLQELALSDDDELEAPLSPEAAPTRFRLFADIAGSLRGASEQQPLLLVLEDVHWADEAALTLCKFLVEQLQNSRLMIVCTCRDTVLTSTDPRASLLLQLANRGELLKLGPLEKAEVATLLGSGTSLTVDDRLATDVLRWTGGNPLFVRGLVPILQAQHGSLHAEALREVGIPSGIREAIRAQLAPLSSITQHVLSKAAVLGEDFALSVLREMEDAEPASLTEAIAQAVGHQILQASGPGRHRFSHALFRESLYAALGGAERMRLHHQAAVAFERLGFAQNEEHAGTIAHHFANAVPLEGATERALHYSVLAGRAALARFAHEEARDRFLSAKNLLTSGPDNPRQRDVLIGLGDAQRLCGALDDAKRTFLALADQARSSGDALALADAALGYGRAHFETGNVEQTLIGLLQESLAWLPKADSSTRIMLLARLVSALQFDRDAARRAAMVDESVAMARRLGDANALAHALHSEMYHCWLSADPAVRRRWIDVASESVSAAQTVKDYDLLAASRMLRCTALLERGEYAEMREELARYMELCEKIQHPMHAWFAQLTYVTCATLEGRLDDAEQLLRATFEMGQRIGTPMALIFSLCQGFAIARDRGTLGQWAAGFNPDAGPFPYSFGMVQGAIALTHHELGDRKAGLAQVDRLVATGFGSQLLDPNWPSILTFAADAAAALDHKEAAAELYDLLLPHSGMVACVGTIVIVGGLVDHSLGVLALTLGRPAQALEHLQLGRQIAMRIGARAWQARCDFALARAAAACGDQTRADDHLARARGSAETLGMKGLLADLAKGLS